MSKLRVIRERTQNIEVENDIRSLGGGDLIKGHQPKPVLLVEGASESSIAKCSQAFGLKHEVVDGVAVLSSHTDAANFKEEHLTLFACALLLTHKSKDLKFHLDDVHTLHNVLMSAIHPVKEHVHSIHSIVEQWKSHKTTRSLGVGAQHALHHAGVDIRPSSEWLSLSHGDLKSAQESFLAKQATHVAARKVA